MFNNRDLRSTSENKALTMVDDGGKVLAWEKKTPYLDGDSHKASFASFCWEGGQAKHYSKLVKFEHNTSYC